MGASGSSSAPIQFGGPHDIHTQSGLTNLYNQKVVSSQRVQRPLDGWNGKVGPLYHEGVLITTESGTQHLVHKAKGGAGSGGQTVVTDARYMSNKWTPSGGAVCESGNRNVGDVVKAGGPNYNLVTDNCQDGARHMMPK